MRLGIVLAAAPGASPLESLRLQASTAERLGFELGWLEASSAEPVRVALAAAAALAPATSSLRLAAEVVADVHPVTIAEEAAVVDLCSNGRLVLILRHDSDPERLAETADLVLAAAASRPFRHAGAHWTVPANLPENEDHERRIMVTPTPVQLELPLWLSGAVAAEPARERALTHVCEAGGESALRQWRQTEEVLHAAAARLRRPALLDVAVGSGGDLDTEALIDRLLHEREQWGLDLAVVRLPAAAGDEDRAAALRRIATLVRPRVQLDALPEHLIAHWRETLPDVAAAPAG